MKLWFHLFYVIFPTAKVCYFQVRLDFAQGPGRVPWTEEFVEARYMHTYMHAYRHAYMTWSYMFIHDHTWSYMILYAHMKTYVHTCIHAYTHIIMNDSGVAASSKIKRYGNSFWQYISNGDLHPPHLSIPCVLHSGWRGSWDASQHSWRCHAYHHWWWVCWDRFGSTQQWRAPPIVQGMGPHQKTYIYNHTYVNSRYSPPTNLYFAWIIRFGMLWASFWK